MIIVRQVKKNEITGEDAALIVKTLNKNKKHSLDNAKIDDAKIREIFYADSTRLAIGEDGEYLGFCFLTDIIEKLSATFHGYILDTSSYYKFKKNHVFDLIFIDYFKMYNIQTINVYLPEYLKTKKVGKLTIEKPSSILLQDAGFKCSSPLKNYAMKNDKPIDLFVFQVHRFWFAKWQNVKKDYESGRFSNGGLAIKYKLHLPILEKIILQKNWEKTTDE
jgi:hypothetical protein